MEIGEQTSFEIQKLEGFGKTLADRILNVLNSEDKGENMNEEEINEEILQEEVFEDRKTMSESLPAIVREFQKSAIAVSHYNEVPALFLSLLF